VGLLDGPRVPVASGLDAHVRAREHLAAGGPRSRLRPAAPRDGAAARAGQGARAVRGAPRPRARRPGLRPGEARADARDPRHVGDRAVRVRQPGAGLGQLGDPRAGGLAGAEGALPAHAAAGRPALGLLDDRARHAGLGSHSAQDPRGPRRRRLRDHRPQVVLVERVDRRLPHRHGGHRPGRAPAPERLDVRRRRRHARGEHPPRR
ncbi:MAG: Butyryl-CoA dehydrogenase, partial [uncultured Solirubrobacteraceae bacterium]